MKKIKIFLMFSVITLFLLVSVGSIEDLTKTVVSVSNTTQGVITGSVGINTSKPFNLEEIPPPAKAISVRYTQTEISELEIREIVNPRESYSLGFISEGFVPTQKLDQRLQAKIQEFSTSNYSDKNYAYGFIMITGIVTPEKLQTITNYGVELLGYHSGHSYKAKIPLAKVNEIKGLSFVKWIGYSTLKQKLNPNLFDKINVINNQILINDTYIDEKIPIYINLFDDEIGEYGKVLEQKGIKINRYYERLSYYTAYASPEAIKNILSLDFVLSIEKRIPLSSAHDESMSSMGADYLRGSIYDGSGISVGVIDTGYEEDHQDLPPDSFCIDYVGNDCNQDHSPIGHGTHVAGTIWGRGNANSKYKGVATGITDIQIAKVSDQLLNPFQDDAVNAMNWMALSPPAEIVSMSMGVLETNCNGTDVLSREVDDHVYLDRQIYVIAAGNEFDDFGVSSIRYPGCAKNTITIGSVRDSGEGIIDSLAPDSSRGPTGDSRKKPDIVAPGCTITSTNSQNNNGYRDLCGTSMATPHVSGLIATLLEHYPTLKGNASAVKAMLAANALVHAGDILNVGNSYGHGKVDSYIAHWNRDNPNGWKAGRVSGELDNTGSWQFFDITVPADADRLVVVLSWTEPAASASANQAVINDLDLYVDKGANEANCEAGEWSSTSGVDNVEYVYIDNPGGDTFRLKFCPFGTIQNSPQKFSAAYMIIRGDPTPSSTLTQFSEVSVYIDEEFNVSATVSPSSYVASGVYTKITMPAGVSIISMSTTREDGVTMNYGSDNDINLGDIIEGDDRKVTWTLKATSTGIKTIGTSMNSDNSGTTSTSIDVNVSLRPDGYSCSSDSQCSSGYCDNDGVGLSDDNWCFTPYNTYFDGEENTMCEISTGNGDLECDEIQGGTGDCNSTCNLVLPNDTHKFNIKNSTNDVVAWIGSEGNIVLKGQCFSGGNCDNPGPDSFIIRNSTNDNVAFINSTGDLCIEVGDCSDQSTSCSPTRDAFRILNSSDDTVIYIDFDGDLCLTGQLFENSNP